jgi:hypothetical protein
MSTLDHRNQGTPSSHGLPISGERHTLDVAPPPAAAAGPADAELHHATG